MIKLEFNAILRIVVGVISLSVIGGLAVALLQSSKVQHLTLAAGSLSGASYILGRALKKVVERNYPVIRFELRLWKPAGPSKNLQMLDDGRAQLAAAQSGVLPGSTARIVALLYDDVFQLLAPKDSPVRSFADLRGKRIALAQSGGQFQSFLRVAGHFGMHQADFRFVGATDEAADLAFSNGQADAIFRVRARQSIQKPVQSGNVRFLPIEHVAAMKIKQPAFEPSLIPEGTYLGSPPVLRRNLPTVAIHRTLLAREDANAAAIGAVTAVLMERREEIMQEIPEQMTEVRLLLAQVRRPEPQAGLGPPLHAGAAGYYDKDKPSFLLAHADYVGLILTVVLMLSSWVWELKRWVQKQQKNTADRYSNRVVALMSSAQGTNSLSALDDIWIELLSILTEAVHDLDADKLSEESFESFRSILQITMDVTRDRRIILASASPTALPQPAGS
jgi:TRAP transporter TAXI family solute receptor